MELTKQYKMSTILFLNRSKNTKNNAVRQHRKARHGRNFIRPPRGNQRRYPRRAPNHVVVSKQPMSATVINMESNGLQAISLNRKNEKPPASYFCLSVACFCICPLFAAFAIFFSSQVNPNHSRGNAVGAKMSSRFALLFCILSVLTTAGIAVYLIYIFGLSSSTTSRDTLVEWWNANWNIA
ncbi:uncharacterized protein [Apostichopus japonicus]|uniref:uncharacterized protein isoform X2 n=1 Tax=Stichopus japonicus TaxID=307972 RepID=UPI003AB7DA89